MHLLDKTATPVEVVWIVVHIEERVIWMARAIGLSMVMKFWSNWATWMSHAVAVNMMDLLLKCFQLHR